MLYWFVNTALVLKIQKPKNNQANKIASQLNKKYIYLLWMKTGNIVNRYMIIILNFCIFKYLIYIPK